MFAGSLRNPVIIIGAGPAGLFCAYSLIKNNIYVQLYEKMTRPGNKFLLAGKGGLNITNAADPEKFADIYGKNRSFFKNALSEFSPQDFISWCKLLGFDTYKGNNSKIFVKQSDISSFLKKWIEVLSASEFFTLKSNFLLDDIKEDKTLIFKDNDGNIESVNPDFAVFALGGASRPETGSDGKWKEILRKIGIAVNDFKPANCGFDILWSSYFKEKAAGNFLKNIEIHFNNYNSRGEVILTDYGIQGDGIYRLSSFLRERISDSGEAVITLDLLPDTGKSELAEKFKNYQQGKLSFSNYLRKIVKLDKVKILLLREILGENWDSVIKKSPEILKALNITLNNPRPLKEAISSAGGVDMCCVNNNLMAEKFPGFYFAGEMLDWEAPTGGFLLQGCFSTAYIAAYDIIRQIKEKN